MVSSLKLALADFEIEANDLLVLKLMKQSLTDALEYFSRRNSLNMEDIGKRFY